MKHALSKNQHVIDQQPARRRRLRVLVASAAVAALAVSWGGFTAMETLAAPGVASLTASETGRAAASPVSGKKPGLDVLPAPVVSPLPSPALPSGTEVVDTTDPGQEAGQHGKHAADRGNAPGAPGLGSVGKPLSGEERPVASAAGRRPGTQQELSLGAAAAQPLPAVGNSRAAARGGAKDRTAGLVPRGPVDPADVMGGRAALGGCLAEYGANGQCLPVIPPSMAEHARQMVESGISLDTMPHAWSCTEVRELFADGLAVRQAGVDPQKLDVDGDGTACGPND